MRLPAILLISSLLLLSSCTYLENLGDFLGIPELGRGSRTNQPPTAFDCGEDVFCIKEHLKSCTLAKGTITLDLPEGKETGNLEVGGYSKDVCSFTYTVESSYNPDFEQKKLFCLAPDSLLYASFEDILDPQTGLCAGDFARTNKIIFSKKTYFSSEDVLIEEDFISFKLKNKLNDLYLNKIVITGNFFSNCILEFKRPYRFQKGELKDFSIGCDRINDGHRNYPGKIQIDFTLGNQSLSADGYLYARVI